MSDPAPNPTAVEISVLELLFATLGLAIETLGPVAETWGIADYARDLQDAITSYWRLVHEDDEIPF